jgi:hypothetical protein
MRKQARRLWLGDWQRDHHEEPAVPRQVADRDQLDTFVIMPLDDAEEQPPEPRRNAHRGLAGLAAVALLFGLGFVVSSGGTDKPLVPEPSRVPPPQTPQTPNTQVPPAQVPVPQGAPPQGFGGADLTGPAAAKAAEAALARYPGTVERVTRGPAGRGYVVHVFQADGNEVHVLVDDQFKVQDSDSGSPRPNSGSGTPQ